MADTDVQSNDVDTLRPAAGDGGATGDTSADKDKSNPDGCRESKPRPAPVDVAAAQNAGQDGGIKTPTTSSAQTPRSAAGPSRNDTFRDRERKIGHRRIDEGGVVTYKKIGSNQLMASIQLGIQQAVGSLASKPDLDVLIQDFYVVETIFFPNSGSQSTPAHQFSDFRFKVYAPIAFRHFRDLFRIQPDDYLVSLCTEPLRELSNPGASGSIFYLTNDDEFIIKTVQHKEAEFLQKLLPGYYMNLRQNPRTLLPKFFGLYNYQCNAKNIRLIVMNNILPSSIKMHQRYDLKGSTYKRKANKYERSKDSPTFKDLDFMEHHPEGILLEAETHKALINTIARDCRVLTSFKIMDYSLLVGIHNLDLAAKKKAQEKERRLNGGGEGSKAAGGGAGAGGGGGGAGGGSGGGGGGMGSSGGDGVGGEDAGGEGAEGASLTRSRSINRHKLVAHSTAMESIQADSDPIDEEDQVPPGGIPARNVKGERLLLFLGIIDILQSFRLKKKLEHTFKSMIHDGDTISVHRPTFYAQRFLKFMENTVFKKIPSPLRHSPSRRRGASLRVMRPMSQTDPEHPSEPHEGQEGSGGRLTGGLTAITSTATSAAATTTATSSPAVTVTPGAAAAATAGGGGPVAAGLGTGAPSTPVNLPAVLQDRPHSGRGRVPPPVPPRSPRGGGATQAAPVTSSFSISRGGVAYLTMPPSPRYPGGSPRFSHLCSPSIGMTGYNIWHVDSVHKLERECMNPAVHAHGKGRQHYVWQLPTEDVMRLQLSDVSPEVTSQLGSRRSSAENALHAVREAWGAIKTASRPTSPVTPPHATDKESSPSSQHHSLSHHFRPSCLDRQTSDDKKNQQFVLPDTHITSAGNLPYSQTLTRKDVDTSISYESDKRISANTKNQLLRSSPQSISASHVSKSDSESQLLQNAVSENQPRSRRTWDESRMQASYPELERARQLEYMPPHVRQSYAGVEGVRTQYSDPKRNSMIDPSPAAEEQYINHVLSHQYGRSRSPSPRTEYLSQSPYRRPSSPYQSRGRHSPYIPSQTPSPRSQPLATQMAAMSDVTLYQNSPSKDERRPLAPYATSHSVGGDLSQLYTEHSKERHSPSPVEQRTFFLSEI